MTYTINISDELSHKILTDYTEEDIKEFMEEAVSQLFIALKRDIAICKAIKEREEKGLDIPEVITTTTLYVDEEDDYD